MTLIPLYQSDELLVKKALGNDRIAEEKIFKRYAPKMLSICRTYIKDLHYAEDVMISGFTKVFNKLAQYRFEGRTVPLSAIGPSPNIAFCKSRISFLWLLCGFNKIRLFSIRTLPLLSGAESMIW